MRFEIYKHAALLSQICYDDPLIDRINQRYLNHYNYKLISSSGIGNDHRGYFGVAFQKENVILIASRGSEMHEFTDLKTDLNIFLNKKISQIKSADQFISKIVEQHSGNNTIILTGHSLGGLISELVGLKTNLPVISFDTPGGYKLSQKYDFVGKISEKNITTFLPSPNFVNTFGKHISNNIYKLNFYTNPHSADLIGYFKFSTAQHKIEKMVTAINKLNALPQKTNDWPEGLKQAFIYFLNNESVWIKKAEKDYEANKLIKINDHSFTKSLLNGDLDIFSKRYVKVKEKFKTLDEYKEFVLSTVRKAAINFEKNKFFKYYEVVKSIKDFITSSDLTEEQTNLFKSFLQQMLLDESQLNTFVDDVELGVKTSLKFIKNKINQPLEAALDLLDTFFDEAVSYDEEYKEELEKDYFDYPQENEECNEEICYHLYEA